MLLIINWPAGAPVRSPCDSGECATTVTSQVRAALQQPAPFRRPLQQVVLYLHADSIKLSTGVLHSACM